MDEQIRDCFIIGGCIILFAGISVYFRVMCRNRSKADYIEV